jgi:dihydrofolate reductase
MTITLIAAITSDGFIGREDNDRSFDWTSEEDSRFYVKSLRESDAIVMGSKTFSGINLHPKNSHYVIYSRNPEGFKNPRPEVITTEATNLTPKKLLLKLKNDGYKKILVAGGSSIYRMFIEDNALDVLHLVKEPVEFGEGIPLFKNINLEEALKAFELISEKPLNDQGTILQEWRIRKEG